MCIYTLKRNEQPYTINCAEVQSMGKKREVSDRKMEAVYHRRVKQPENEIWKVKEKRTVLGDGPGKSVPKVVSVVETSAVAVMPGDQDYADGFRLVNVKFKEVEITEKLAEASVSFRSCVDTVEEGTGPAGASTRVGVAQTTTVHEVGSTQEYSD
jgi:hypothetical protein